jgi:prophage tail gpP-like protein
VSSVSLAVNGAEYGGWKSIAIQRGIEQIAGTFSLSVSDRWPGQDTPRPIRPGDACTVKIDGETVITGYVDDLDLSYDANSHQIGVSGRDKTADLVDCSAIHAPGEWRGVTLLQLAAALCQPFGIAVSAQTDLGAPFSSFALQESETAFEALERAAKMRGALLVSDGKGGMVLTQVGAQSSAVVLKLGENILAASGQFSHRDRYSQYLIKGQRRGTDDDADAPHAITEVSASAADAGVRRHRPLMILAEDLGDGVTYGQRIAWERAVRFGKSIRSTVTVQGWRERGPSGPLWTPNKLVHLTDHWQGVDEDLLIVSVAFRLDEGGQLTELELTRPEAFDTIAMEKHTKKKGKKGSSDTGEQWH